MNYKKKIRKFSEIVINNDGNILNAHRKGELMISKRQECITMPKIYN